MGIASPSVLISLPQRMPLPSPNFPLFACPKHLIFVDTNSTQLCAAPTLT
jgi:hypothetical protein